MSFRTHAIGGGLTLALACLTAAAAEQGVHRCLGSHGEIAFSQSPCRPGPATPEAGAGLDNAATPRPQTECATSPDAVHRRLRAALARGDANALAALVDWRGAGSNAARHGMARLDRLATGPLLGLEAGPDGFLVRSGSQRSGQHETWLALTTRGGCFWLREGLERWPPWMDANAPDPGRD